MVGDGGGETATVPPAVTDITATDIEGGEEGRGWWWSDRA